MRRCRSRSSTARHLCPLVPSRSAASPTRPALSPGRAPGAEVRQTASCFVGYAPWRVLNLLRHRGVRGGEVLHLPVCRSGQVFYYHTVFRGPKKRILGAVVVKVIVVKVKRSKMEYQVL